jgi:nitroreductase
VPREYIDKMLWAATRAPSGGNRQPWRFVVIDDREKIQQLADLYQEGWEIYMRDTIGAGPSKKRSPEQEAAVERNLRSAQYLAEHIHEAPALIMVCIGRGDPQRTMGAIYPAIQNLTLAARALGLGTSITTVLRHRQEGVRNILRLPEEAHYIALIPLGWPMGRFGAGPRKPVKDVAYLNEWGNAWPEMADSTAAEKAATTVR